MYKRYWLVAFWFNGFEGKMLVYGTEEELWDYLSTDLPTGYTYHGASEREVQAAETLKIKKYLCPIIKH